jgi:hypothetical protein
VLLRALCARAWPVLTGHRRAHDWLPASRVGVMLCGGQAKVGKPEAKQGRAIVAAKIKQPALFFSSLRVSRQGPHGRFPGFGVCACN